MDSLLAAINRDIDALVVDLEAFALLAAIAPPEPDRGIVFLSPTPFDWKPLPIGAMKLQKRLRQRYQTLHGISTAVLVPHHAYRTTIGDLAVLSVFINQFPSSHDSSANHLKACVAALASLRTDLERVAAADDPTVILVPDTNALYRNPMLEEWRMPGLEPFVFAIVPAVMGELDRHKDNHANEAVRQKASKLVRMIREYMRRGEPSEGVPLVRGISRVMILATEPPPQTLAGWLDAHGNTSDERILASALDLARDQIASTVVLVTRDTGAQARCKLARIHAVDPPDPLPHLAQ